MVRTGTCQVGVMSHRRSCAFDCNVEHTLQVPPDSLESPALQARSHIRLLLLAHASLIGHASLSLDASASIGIDLP